MADDDRGALDARAYGRAASGDERTAAQREWLERRAARREAAERTARLSASVADPSVLEAQDPMGLSDRADAPSDPDSAPVEVSRRRFSRGVVAGVAALALLVGAGVGVGAALMFGNGSAAINNDSATESGSTSDLLPATGDPAETSRLAAGDAAVGSDSLQTTLEAADALLARRATAADKYPLSFDANDVFETTSTRLVTAAGTSADVFVARAAQPDGGFCLLISGRVRSAQDSSASASCATRSDFAQGGLTYMTHDYTISWFGGQVSVTVGPQ
ncbi:hypothetical protein [Frondihabitans sp. VKM Ac-2883]|uniref:hypothetical protein n=1 Tax=Frondihabitans sp. VKM Ac-2883 TaxID=2783823 RepID=UPI00188CAF7C|nr:hypothetical protein [Frondihabitans sp. VKM Ac-2883]MBF4576142.1 hypothetical protein [Frondihabitans sp. VKM Ac-2883]